MENKTEFKTNFLLKFVTYDLTNEIANLQKNKKQNFSTTNLRSKETRFKNFEESNNSISNKHSISHFSIKDDV